MSRALATAVIAALVATLAAPVAAAPDHSTGLERALEVSMKALDHVRGKSADAPGHNKDGKVTGKERAAQAIASRLERGNGRGHAAAVLQLLLEGRSPSELAGEHGAAVSNMARAYNALKRSAG